MYVFVILICVKTIKVYSPSPKKENLINVKLFFGQIKVELKLLSIAKIGDQVYRKWPGEQSPANSL